MDREVLAVDMLTSPIKFMNMSLTLSNLGHKVTLVQNGLWSGYTTLQANINPGNVGGNSIKEEDVRETSVTMEIVSAVRMDDLIPIFKSKKVIVKMDIENAEDDALRCAEMFFTKVDEQCRLM